jgi:CRP/FNR family transcriptional regulator, cyclic AMP receptor protein
MFFKGIPLFAGLSESEHGLFLQVALRRTYPRHTLLIQENDPGENLYLLRKGRAKVYIGDEGGREVILAILGPGDFFGELALIDDAPCSASVMTLEESEFVSIGKNEFRKVLASSPGMAVNLLKVLAGRLREADLQIESLALKDVQSRVEQVLHSLAEPEGGEFVIPSRITHRDIATMVGASREVVTRAFRSLEDHGVVLVDGRRITLITVPAVSSV